MGIEIVEQYSISKTGHEADSEDRLVVTGDYAAVVDGATAKTDRLFEGHTPGAAAAAVVCDAIRGMPPGLSAAAAVKQMSDAISEYYRKHGLLGIAERNPWDRLTASVAILCQSRRQIWLVGDCQALAGRRRYRGEKEVDRVLAATRALVLELALLEGRTESSLRSEDVGRAYIFDLLERQQRLANAPAALHFSYPVINGFPVPSKGIRRVLLGRNVRHVVLASDGYPDLRWTLDESEDRLRELLRADPLCFRRHRTTKGVMNGDVSFDDRTYLKLDLAPGQGA